ncbi:hypothetical protein SEMRO_675_G185580.1 [Seminavis robusta]|uniref:Uncharacterized protein n=1 Tax=Seminavis robusta TaxID=568900 RepID=A0A9N8HH20_9STRA|nr:hypothetical protein SEMRO_675_G185580.1 [Seminavis robusta]|eukprot:Sro675_g185580.1 n/a (187) ;mRNA; f:50349-50909
MPRYSMTNFAFNIRFVDPSGRSRRVLGHGNPGNLFLDFQDLDRFGAEILPSSDDDSSVEEVAPPAAAPPAEIETPRVKTKTKTNKGKSDVAEVVDLLNSSGSSSGSSTNVDDLSAIVPPEEEQAEEEIEDEVEFIGRRLDQSVNLQNESDTSSDYSVAHGFSQEALLAPTPVATHRRSRRVASRRR